ncbi:hypothetical protein DL546_004655 [Coniochaeta pulveracea]|uniref:Uncharacterized protein n=1 Tax=Coniochaeta pulveracea TaxID=177199 RepID=A0A420Y3D1_9PEZI|nr:hypothetical protein DL546_004655 [Coniochaeta pulveracea]
MNGNKNRYPQPVKCRWDDCPVKHRTITQGQYRVCFDEHADTSGRTTDPFHNTGYMHLYCFERCAPLISLIKNPPPGMVRVKPDDRRFPNLRENGNPMQLGGSSAAHSQQFIETYNTWVEDTWPKWQNNQMTSRDTLYYTLADLHLRMFPNRQTTTAHLRDYMGDLDRMQELRDQKGRLKRKRDRDDDDDEEEEERPRQRAKTQDLGQPQSAAPLHPQQHVGNGYQTSGHGQAAGQPATNGPSQPFDQPQPRPAQNPARYDGYTQVPPPAPIAGYKRRRTDDDDGTCESGRQQEYGSSAEPHTPKRVKVSIPSAPNRQHNSRYSRSSQPRIPAPRFQPVPQRPVNLPMLDDPFVVDPRFQVDPVLSAPSINLNLSPNPNFNPDVSSSYADPMAVPGLSTDFLAPEQGVTQPAQTPTRYSEPSDIDIENWTRGTSVSPD